jgi:soluble lytic murein transglycosylase
LALTGREKKLLAILSQFRTGLREEEKERLVIFISEESRRYDFDPELIVALISTESSFYNWSSSPKGAIGLMQIIPTTGRELAEINNIVWQGEKEFLFDPFLNIKLGIHYLSMLHLRFKDIELALSAYNYGPGNIRRWIDEGEPIPAGYATKVLRYYERFLAFDGKTGASDLVSALDDEPASPEEKVPSPDVSKVSVRF